jgi:hypothetical protein
MRSITANKLVGTRRILAGIFTVKMRSRWIGFLTTLRFMWHRRLTRGSTVSAKEGCGFQSTRRVNAVKESLPKCKSLMLFARAIGLTQKIDIINLAA